MMCENKKTFINIYLKAPILVLFICLGTSAHAAPGSQSPYSVQDVIDCVSLNNPDSSFRQIADIVIRDESGKSRRMQARFLGHRERGGLLLNIRLLSPGNMAGTAVLVRERERLPDDIRLYLPALARTRYISDAMSDTKLFDTDFSYADIKKIYGAFVDSPTLYRGIEKWEGRNVHKLQVMPSERGTQPYNSLVTFVDTDTCVVVGVDFLDSEDEAQRKLRADVNSLVSISSRHLAKRYTMSDLLRGSTTTISLRNIKLDEKVPAEAFEPGSFYLSP